MHCCRFHNPPQTRREMLAQCANGFGAVALAALLDDRAFGGHVTTDAATRSMTPHLTHHVPRATSVIFLYMDGGPSQVDTFDPKPRLEREDGQPIRMKAPPTQFIAH